MKRIAPILIFCFLLTFIQPVKADSLVLPKPGTMVNVSPSFVAPTLRGIKVHRDDPFRFDFVLDQGDQKSPVSKPEATKLVKYFLAAVTTPYGDLWVNLSPYEKDRIVPQSFGQTEMGRDLLAQDYILKQLTASIIYPESQTGKAFWAKVYAQAKERFGTATVPINTFNKVWIVPSEAEVYENPTSGSAYIVKSSLKVMLEQDYLATKKNATQQSAENTQVVREVVLPLIQKEINEGKNFATVRQVYNSLILATWYKKKLKDSVISQAYANQNKVAGIKFNDDQTNEKIYQQYIEAFKVGAYNYIKEEQDPLTQKTIPRKYFSGGASFGNIDKTINITNKAMSAEQAGKRQFVVEANLAFSGSVPLDKAMLSETRRKFLGRAAQIAVAGTVLALAGSDEQKIESVIMQGYNDDEKAELEAIQRAQLKDKEGVAQLLKFTDKMQKKILQIRQGMNELQKVLSTDADSNVVIIYESENENLVPEPLAQGEANLDATATAIRNLLTEQGKGMINLPLTITSVTEAVLHGIADPWTMLKRANPDAFKNRKIFYVRISPDTLKNATKYRAAMDAIRTHARFEGKPIVAISKRDSNTPMLPRVEVVAKRLPAINVVSIGQTNIGFDVMARFQEAFYNRKYFSPEEASKKGKTPQALAKDTKTSIVYSVLDHVYDITEYRNFLASLKKMVQDSSGPIVIVQFKDTAEAELLEKEIVLKSLNASDAIIEKENLERLLNIIWQFGGDMDLAGENAKKLAKDMITFSYQDIGRSLVSLYPELQTRDISTASVFVRSDFDLVEKITNHRNTLVKMVASRRLKMEDIHFLTKISRASTSNEIDVILADNKDRWAFLRKVLQESGGEPSLKALDQRIVDEKSRTLFAQNQGKEVAAKVQKALESIEKITESTVLIPISRAQASGLNTGLPEGFVAQKTNIEDRAMRSNDSLNEASNYGGIDFNDLDIGLSGNGEGIKFNLSPETLQKTQSAPGLTPIILNILPLSNLKEFLQ